jgi:multiple sugar transport system permease protein
MVSVLLGQSFYFLTTGVLGLFYYIIFWAMSGKTPGKRALGIAIVSANGSRMGVSKSIIRFLCYFISAIPLGLGFLWAIWDPNKQAWHDKLAGTFVVVDEMPAEIVSAPPGISALTERPAKGDLSRAWACLILPLALMLLFLWFPVISLFLLSLTKSFMSKSTFAGFINYLGLFGDPSFRGSFGNSLSSSVLNMNWVYAIVVPFCIAYLLVKANRRRELTARGILSVLILCGSGVLMSVAVKAYCTPTGPLNVLLARIGLPTVGSSKILTSALRMAKVGYGLGIAIPLGLIWYMALFRGMAGATDGSITPRRVLFRLGASAALIFLTFFAFSMKGFAPVYLITGGGDGTNVLMTSMYRTAFIQGNFGYGAAHAVMLALFLLFAGFLVWMLVDKSHLAIWFSSEKALPISLLKEGSHRVVLILVCLALVWAALVFVLNAVLPLLYALFGAFKTATDSLGSPASLLPHEFNTTNFGRLFSDGTIWYASLSTVVTVVPSLILQLGASVLGGYALGRLRFPGRKAIFLLVCLTMFISPSVLIAPIYTLTARYGLLNMHMPLILFWAGCPLGIFMFKLFFEGARRDATRMTHGGSEIEISSTRENLQSNTWRMTAFVGLILAFLMLEDILLPIVIMSKSTLLPFNAAIVFSGGRYTASNGAIFAFLTIALIPMALIAVFLILLQPRFLSRMHVFMSATDESRDSSVP